MRRPYLKTMTAALALLAGSITAGPSDARWGEGYFPNTEVVTQDGETVHFYDDLIRGKMLLISFIYTSCKDLCPINTARIAQVAEELGDRMGKDVFFLSISVDPVNDTPERLKAFASAFYDGPGWTFITGDEAILREIGEKLGNNSTVPANHRNEVVLGNEATGDWARNTPFGEIQALTAAVLDLDPEWRNQIRQPETAYLKTSEYAHLQMSDEPGQALFKKMCSPCHTVGVGDRVGPDLLGVTERRTKTWLSQFIQDPERLRRAGDIPALQLMAQYPGARMPSFGLTEIDAADLIAYLEETSAAVAQARAEAIAHDASHAQGGHGHHGHGDGAHDAHAAETATPAADGHDHGDHGGHHQH